MIDPTTITAPVFVRTGPYDTEQIATTWWATAEAIGFYRTEVNGDAYSYDNHMTIDRVKIGGTRLDDLDHEYNDAHCAEVFGYRGVFYAVCLDPTTSHAVAVALEVNDGCPNCGGEFDLAPRDGCREHISSETDDEPTEHIEAEAGLVARNGARVTVRIETTEDGPVIRVIGGNCDLEGIEPAVYMLTNVK